MESVQRERHAAHVRFANSLRKLPLEELQDMAAAVKETVGSRGWDVVLELLKRDEAALVDQMVESQKILSHHQYANLVGEIAGLRLVAGAAHTILLVASEEEEKERDRIEREADSGRS